MDERPPMIAMGRKRTGSKRAHHVRFGPESRHRPTRRHIRLVPWADSCTAAKSILIRSPVGGARRVRIEVERLSGPEVDDQREFARLTW